MRLVRSTLWLLSGMSVALACGSSEEPPASTSSSGGSSGGDAGTIPIEDIDLAVYPLRQYTGFDGAHDFQAPLGVFRAKEDLEVTASDPSMVEILPAQYKDAKADGQYFLLKAKKAGEVTLTARSRGKTVTSTLVIQQYSADDYAVGEARYTEGPSEGATRPCAGCHRKPDGADHSPAAISAADDNAVKAVISTGIDLSNSPIRSVEHRWEADAATLDGLVTYLRALPPRGYTVGASTRSLRQGGALSLRPSGLLRHARFSEPNPAEEPRAALASFARKHPGVLGAIDVVRDLQVQKQNARITRWQQLERGLPVFGAELTAHFDPNGALRGLDATLADELSTLDLSPRITPEEAEQVVLRAFAAREGHTDNVRFGWQAWGETGARPTLGVHVRRSIKPRLAYAIGLAAEARDGRPVRLRARVDARTGELVELYDDVKTIAAEGRGVRGQVHQFEARQSGSGYELRDDTRKITTYTAGENLSLPGVLVTSPQLDRWDESAPNGAGAAVDAHYYAGAVYDFFKTTFNRDSIDGKGAPILSTVHFGLRYDNAFWEGRQMAYGDGNRFGPFASAPDIVAHELTHAITQKESDLEYRFQSGAINEAVSDIFGAIVEHSIEPDPVGNWIIGENVQKGPKPPRDMSAPKVADPPQPSHMQEYLDWTLDQDNGGVHLNSGIVNHAAYLMTVGGTHKLSKVQVSNGIGWAKLAKLFYLVSTDYLQRQSEFIDLASATLDAADDLAFTIADKRAIGCAWEAVGVLENACIADPDVPAPTGGSSGTNPNPGGGGDDDDDDNSSGNGGGGGSSGRGRYGATGRGDGAGDADFDAQASACHTSAPGTSAPFSVLTLATLLLLRKRKPT